MSAEQTPDIAAVLAEHEGYPSERYDERGTYYVMCCDCGWEEPKQPDAYEGSSNQRHRAHVAQALAPVLAAAVREARDAGIAEGMAYDNDWRYCPQCGRRRDWVGESSPGAPCMGCHRYPAARADRVAVDAPEGGEGR